jgi:membrane associated rhomboid family serine protease
VATHTGGTAGIICAADRQFLTPAFFAESRSEGAETVDEAQGQEDAGEMGIEGRDYMQETPAYREYNRGGWTAVKLLIVLNVAVFLAQTLTTGPMSYSAFRSRLSAMNASDEDLRAAYERARQTGQLPTTSPLDEWLALDSQAVLHGQIWRLTTFDFLHDTSTIWHLVFNMWLLFIAGRRVEGVYGKNEFLAFYLVAGILSGVMFLVWDLLTGSSGIAIGASGAAVAVMIVYAMHWPQERWYIWGVLPMPVMLLALIGAALDVFPMFEQLRGGQGDHVAHAAHVGGMLFGFFYVHYRWRILDWGESLGLSNLARGFRRRPRLRVHAPEPEEQPVRRAVPVDVEARLDQLLEKITQHGEASLTDEERRFLTETSRRYRNRR